jgi:peroxisomal membrane protein 4
MDQINININNHQHRLCDHPNCWISAFKGLRNGMYYGGKVRFVHSLVMTILFRSGSLENKIISILKMTWEHARNLGVFVLFYKSLVCVLRHLFNSRTPLFNFISGFFASYLTLSREATAVNMQIMLYLLSRDILAMANIASNKYMNGWSGFTLTSMTVWGIVMFLFEYNSKLLQNSLTASMDFIYKESDKKYGSILDFIPFYIPLDLFK